jgi:hypothetical protein
MGKANRLGHRLQLVLELAPKFGKRLAHIWIDNGA